METLASLKAKLATLGGASTAERQEVLSAIAKLGGTPPVVPATSPEGTQATTITAADGAVWTLGPEHATVKGAYQTLRNGVHVGGGHGQSYLQWQGVYTLSGGNYWKWINGAWRNDGPANPAGTGVFSWKTPMPAPLVVGVGKTLDLAPYATKPAKWTMTAVPIATLSESGVLNGVAEGTADVEISADDT